MIECFNYKKNSNKSYIIFISLILFFIMLYSICIWGLLLSNKNKKYRFYFWLIFVLALLPFFINQTILFVFLFIYIGILLFHAQNLDTIRLYGNKTLSIYLILFTILFILSSYILITITIYFLGNTTYFDLFNNEYYNNDFISNAHLKKYFTFHDETKFLEKSKKGKDKIKNKKVVFGILAKNIAFNFDSLKRKLESLGNYFADYHIIFFENDSNDGSRNLIKQWTKNNKKIELLDCCQFNKCDCNLNNGDLHQYGMRSNKRIDKMREYRQKILHRIIEKYHSFDYYIIMDSDISGSIYLDGFFSTFEKEDWDVVFANGLTTIPFFNKFFIYDGFAFIAKDQNYNYLDNDLNEFLNQNRKLNFNKIIDSEWIHCKSGFNGMAIFKINSLLTSSYYNDYNKSFKCEHIDLYYNMALNDKHKIFFNPSLLLFVGHQGKERIKLIKWK